MNERIRELHNRACRLDMEQYPNAIPDGERIQQKFAELIMQENAAELRLLYAVNQELLEALKSLIRPHGGTVATHADSELATKARAAIAKATGEMK